MNTKTPFPAKRDVRGPITGTCQKKEGDQAPGFTLENIDREEVALSEILEENEVLLVDSWASWCGPCIAKVPKLVELHAAYKDRVLETVYVSFDDRKRGLEDNEVPGVQIADLRRQYELADA